MFHTSHTTFLALNFFQMSHLWLGWAFKSHLFSVLWLSLCIRDQLLMTLQKESLTIADYFKSNRIVISCPFSKTTTVASLLGPMTIRTMVFWLAYSSRYKFSFVEWASNWIREQLVTPITDLPLLHVWAHLAWLASSVAYRVHSWARLLMEIL